MCVHVQNKNGKFARGPGGDLYIMYPNIGRITQFIDCPHWTNCMLVTDVNSVRSFPSLYISFFFSSCYLLFLSTLFEFTAVEQTTVTKLANGICIKLLLVKISCNMGANNTITTASSSSSGFRGVPAPHKFFKFKILV